MAKNKKVMSIAIEPELQEELKDYAKRKDVSVSSYVGDLIAKGIKLSVDEDPIVVGKPSDETVMPIILKLPQEYKGNKEKLTEWLATQTAAIINKLSG